MDNNDTLQQQEKKKNRKASNARGNKLARKEELYYSNQDGVLRRDLDPNNGTQQRLQQQQQHLQQSVEAASSSSTCDVNVTYDLIDGGFCPPPSVSGLSVRLDDRQPRQQQEEYRHHHQQDMEPPPPQVLAKPNYKAVEDLLSQTPPVPPPMPDDDAFSIEDEDDLVDDGNGCSLNPAGIDMDINLDNLRLGEEANHSNYDTVTVSSDHSGEGSRNLEVMPIAEYEGSPRRYRPRASDEPPTKMVNARGSTKESPKSSSGRSKSRKKSSNSSSSLSASKRPPGFPQRVLPNAAHSPSKGSSSAEPSSNSGSNSNPSPSSSTSSGASRSKRRLEQQKQQQRNANEDLEMKLCNVKQVESGVPSSVSEVLLKFDEITKCTTDSPPPVALSPVGEKVEVGGEEEEERVTKQQLQQQPRSYNYQYEFSETRKVLDEFFKPSDAAAENNAGNEEVVLPKEVADGDLNYVLRRRTENTNSSSSSSYIGQRLAENEGQPQGANNSSSVLNSSHSDLLLGQPGIRTSPYEDSDGSGRRLPPEAKLTHPNQSQQPHVGLSPLDQPLVTIGSDLSHASSSNVASSASSMPRMQQYASVQQQSFAVGSSNGSSGGGDTGYATLNSPEASRVANALTTNHGRHATGGVSVSVGREGGGGGGSSTFFQSSGVVDSRNFTLSPETTDCDSADLESEVSINEGSYHSSGPRMHTSMPVLEDGLSSGHASDLEEDVIYSR